MMVLSLTAGTTTDSTAIDITSLMNTNSSIVLNKNEAEIMYPGVYEIAGCATITSIGAGNYGLVVYADGSTLDNSSVNLAAAASETTTIPIYSVVNITATTSSGYVGIEIMPVGTPTIVTGTISIKKIS